MRGTAYWFLYEDTLFVALNVFEKGEGPLGGIVPQVTGEQLEWIESVIADNPGVKRIVTMGHTPVLGPVGWGLPHQEAVSREESVGQAPPYSLTLAGGKDSPLWQTLKKHGADLYLCGEVPAVACTQSDGILQVAHGACGMGFQPMNHRQDADATGTHGQDARATVNYLVATVYPDRIDLELKEIEVTNEGGRLWQMGGARPAKTVRITEEARQKGFATIGTATLSTGEASPVLTNATGCFESQ
jgi:hypothetical protein